MKILTALLFCFLTISVSAQVIQDFEDASVPLRTNDCYASASFSTSTTNAITNISARSSQLSNPANPAIYQLPFIAVDTTSVLSFDHRLSAANGSRNLRVELYSAADNTANSLNNPTEIYSFDYSNAAVQNASIALNVTGVFRIRFVATGSGGNSRVILDNIQVSNASRSTIGSGQGVASSQCNAVIPGSTPPTAVDDLLFASGMTPVSANILTNDIAGTSAINNNRVDLTITSSAEESTLSVPEGDFAVAGGVLTFTPGTGFTTTFSITYTVKDLNGATSNTGTVTITTLGPSSSPVDVIGRVVYDDMRSAGMTNVELVDIKTGETRVAMTNPFGYFRFEGVTIGTHLLTARHKGYDPQALLVDVTEEISDIVLVLTR